MASSRLPNRQWSRQKAGTFFFACTILSIQAETKHKVGVRTIGMDGRPLADVTIEAMSNGYVVCHPVTNTNGQGELNGCGESLNVLHVVARLKGYAAATIDADNVRETALNIALAKGKNNEQTVTVQAQSQYPLTETSSNETRLPIESAKSSPSRPSTVTDLLPLVPGVIRTPDGRVQVSGQDEEHSSLLINSVNVNDPATGDFGIGVPVDTVDVLRIMQSPYLAQYGSFSAGIVSAETRRAGDKWDYSLNDPLPDFRIRSGHLRGLRDAAPRLNLSGPLIRNRLYFVEGSEYLVDKAEVRTLPFPVNESQSSGFNSFTQLDLNAGDRNVITGTLHFAPHSVAYANLNYFDPQSVTPNANYQEDTGTIMDRVAMGSGLITSIFAGTRVATNVNAQAQNSMTLSPSGNSGSYFAVKQPGFNGWKRGLQQLCDGVDSMFFRLELLLPTQKMKAFWRGGV